MFNITMSSKKPPLVIVGVGNILCSDEGVGIHVLKYLKERELPDYVAIYDCGTSGIAVLEALDGAKKGIIVDAVSMGGPPGKIYKFTIDDILGMEDNLFKMVSLHQFDLISTLKVAQITDVYNIPKDIVIIGIEGKTFDFNLELSREIKEVIPSVVDLIMDEITKFGELYKNTTFR